MTWEFSGRAALGRFYAIEVLNVKVGVAIILLLYHNSIKVLKDTLAC
jgi:hypothetical protein